MNERGDAVLATMCWPRLLAGRRVDGSKDWRRSLRSKIHERLDSSAIVVLIDFTAEMNIRTL